MPKQAQFSLRNIKFVYQAPELSKEVLREAYMIFCNTYAEKIPDNDRAMIAEVLAHKRISVDKSKRVDKIVEDYIDQYQLLKQFFRLIFTSLFQNPIEIPLNDKFVCTFNQDVEFFNTHIFSEIPSDKEKVPLSEEKEKEAVQNLLNYYNSKNPRDLVQDLLHCRDNKDFARSVQNLFFYRAQRLEEVQEYLTPEEKKSSRPNYIPPRWSRVTEISLDELLYQSKKDVQGAALDRRSHNICFYGMNETRSLLSSFIKSYVKNEYKGEEYLPNGSSNLAEEFDEVLHNIHKLAWLFFVYIISDVHNGINPEGKNGVFNYECDIDEDGGYILHNLTFGRNFDSKKADYSDMPKNNSTAQGQTEFNVLHSWADALFHAYSHKTSLLFDNQAFVANEKLSVGVMVDFLRIRKAQITRDGKSVKGYDISSVNNLVDDVPLAQEAPDDYSLESGRQGKGPEGIVVPSSGVQNLDKLSEAVAKKLDSKEKLRVVGEQNELWLDGQLHSDFTSRIFDERGRDISEYTPDELTEKNNTYSDYAQTRPSTQLSAMRVKGANNQGWKGFSELCFD